MLISTWHFYFVQQKIQSSSIYIFSHRGTTTDFSFIDITIWEWQLYVPNHNNYITGGSSYMGRSC